MLQSITINDLALIRELEIGFDRRLNVFTGETGAGKSILVDSLMLLIGARYDKSMLKYGADKGFVEGVFTCEDTAPLESMGIECDDGMFIVTRRFYKDGKNDIRVNGKQVTTAMLRELMTNYVDIYGQNEYQSLLRASEQKKILDHYVFGADGSPLDAHKKLYSEYRDTVAQMQSLGDEQARAQRIDILKYQIDEIESAAVEEGEEDRLIERRHILMASERIKNALADCINDLDDRAIPAVSGGMRSVSSVSAFGDAYSSLYDRLRSVSIELDDISSGLKDELDGMDRGERELDELSVRLEKLRSLKNKYGPYDKMMKFLADARSELDRAEHGAELYDSLCAKKASAQKALLSSCEKLSSMRKKGAATLAKRIVAELADLGMPNSSFEVRFSPAPDIAIAADKATPSGYDDFEFYLSANAGQPLMPLAKIISGGEMSRFMLAIKLITGDLGNIDTMIFDEIDAGISGAVGLGVAKKLCKLSRSRQVLCVTHLPQIAAMADGHFYIEKNETEGDTVTSVTLLARDGQIGEIARLSGTKGISDASVRNAEEMKDWTDKFKAELGD